jgi:hypothetical protein
LLNHLTAGDSGAGARLREFHPRFAKDRDQQIDASTLTWSDALLVTAREYGYPSWARLKRRIAVPETNTPSTLTERIDDLQLREAVEALDDGDIEALREQLAYDSLLIARRAAFEGENYFRTPCLLAFIAENPTRTGKLPPNIVEIAELLLDAGAGSRKSDLDETLALVASGRVARECGVQNQLIALLCSRGADPNTGLLPALTHGEFEAAHALLRAGGEASLTFAAATGDVEAARSAVAVSTPTERHSSLALAAMHGRSQVVELLLSSGEAPNRYSPVGAHSHSTPLHQASWNGDIATVQALVAGGARTDLKDSLWKATPLEWAQHAGRRAVAEYLSAL